MYGVFIHTGFKPLSHLLPGMHIRAFNLQRLRSGEQSTLFNPSGGFHGHGGAPK